MRITVMAPFHQVGGSELQVLMMLRGLMQHPVEVIFLHFEIRQEELKRRLTELHGIDARRVVLRSVRNPWIFFRDCCKLADCFRAEHVDVVHCWNYSAQLLGSVAARLAGAPCIFSVGGLDPWKRGWQLPVYQAINRIPAAFVFQSDAERALVTRRERIPAQRSHVIPNGVDRCRFRPPRDREAREELMRELHLDPAEALVLSIGSLRPIKGHDVLIQAVRTLQHTRAVPRFHVLIAGDGPLRDTYAQAAGGLPISFLGMRDDVERLCRAADIYCQPSRSEGLPNAVIEAMCCGCPVVAARTGGLPEIVTPDNGRLFAPGDAAELADALGQVLNDASGRAAMRTASLRIAERFSDTGMVESYVRLYRSVAQPASTPRTN
jgi:glycosyltransferase involved in cell wall biosynthesis